MSLILYLSEGLPSWRTKLRANFPDKQGPSYLHSPLSFFCDIFAPVGCQLYYCCWLPHPCQHASLLLRTQVLHVETGWSVCLEGSQCSCEGSLRQCLEALALFSEGLDVTKWPQGRAVPSVALSCVPFPRSRCRKANVKWPKGSWRSERRSWRR